MTDVLQCIAAFSILVVGVLRVPGALRDRDARPLCVALLALGVGMALWFVARFDVVGLDRATGVPHLTSLLRHLFGVVAVQATLGYLAIVADIGRGALARRLSHAVAVLVALVLVIAFWLIPRDVRRDDFFTSYADSIAATVYWTVFLAFLALALGWSAWTSLSYRRDAAQSALRTGLTWVGVGSCVGIAYATHKAAFVVFRHAGLEGMSKSASMALTSLLFGLSVLCIAIGTSIPWAADRLRQLNAAVAFTRLGPLWEWLVAIQPSIALAENPTRFWDLCHADARLYRRFIEIQDGLLVLRDYCDAHTVAHAEMYAHARLALQGPHAEAFAQAAGLHIATGRLAEGRRVPIDERPNNTQQDDFDAEVVRLVDVSRSMRSPHLPDYLASAATTNSTKEHAK